MRFPFRIPVYSERVLRQAYRRVFEGGATEEDRAAVLNDLRRVCFGDLPTFHENSQVHAFREGMRTVYLRIVGHARLSDASLDAILESSQEEDDG